MAQLMRMGWFRPVHVKTLQAQEIRALLTARRLLVGGVKPKWLEARKARP
jgi:transposase